MQNLQSHECQELRYPSEAIEELRICECVCVCVRAHEWVCARGRRMTWLDLWLRTVVLRPRGEGLGETTWSIGQRLTGRMSFKA